MKKIFLIAIIVASLTKESNASSLNISMESATSFKAKCTMKLIIHLGILGSYGFEYELEPCPSNNSPTFILSDNLGNPIMLGKEDFNLTPKETELNDNGGVFLIDSKLSNLSKLTFKEDVKFFNDEKQSIAISKGEYIVEEGIIKVPFTKD